MKAADRRLRAAEIENPGPQDLGHPTLVRERIHAPASWMGLREGIHAPATRPMQQGAGHHRRAPGRRRGWADTDLPTIGPCWPTCPGGIHSIRQRNARRVSAGVCQAFHRLYVERVPVTAVAALANYLPPSITQEQIQAQRDIPVFYAVGRDDINHERMRAGIDPAPCRQRDVELYRPPIGHVLDPQVAARQRWTSSSSVAGGGPGSRSGAGEMRTCRSRSTCWRRSLFKSAGTGPDQVRRPGSAGRVKPPASETWTRPGPFSETPEETRGR